MTTRTLVNPLFDAFGTEGLYHLGFLVAGLLVLAPLARQLYRCWGPVTDLVTAFVTDVIGGGQSAGTTTDE